MRIILDKDKKPTKYKQKRIVERFLYYPLKLENEIRWLEKAKIQQTAITKLDYVSGFGAVPCGYKWYDEKFVD